MKHYTRAFVVATLVAVVSLVPTLHALTGTVAKMKVPFAFNCGARHFAPGTYSLDFLSADTLLVRKGPIGQFITLISPDISLDQTESGYAVFKKYGDQYFLEEIWMPGSSLHASIDEQKWEKRAAMELAREGSEPSRIELALVDISRPTTR